MKQPGKTAKRKRAQALENKQSSEIADSQPIMISVTYDETRETFRFAWRNDRFVLPFFGSVLARSATARPVADPGRTGASGEGPG
jgi:hypothetical protein